MAATATKRILDTGTDVARAGMAKDHDAKRQKHEQKRPVQQEPSSGSGVKRSSADDEAVRCADAEAEKALNHARLPEERRAAKRASVTSVPELQESLDKDWDIQQRCCIEKVSWEELVRHLGLSQFQHSIRHTP